MKKLLFILLSALSLTAFAQETTKVAILEVVDREGKLAYNQKLVLRSNMARAVANTEGYEAYDRSDLDVIMSEHDFQRTGMVSNDQIAQLGKMTGVSLILVTEGVPVGSNQLYVTSKIINVETGRMDMTENVTMGTDPNMMQQGCNELARKLFGSEAISSQASKDYIKPLSARYYSYRGQTLDEKAYMNFLRNNCPEAFAKYNKGRAMTISAWALLGVGVAITGAGIGMAAYNANQIPKEEYALYKALEESQKELDKGALYWDPDKYTSLEFEADRHERNRKDCESKKDAGIAIACIGPVVILAGSVPLWCCGAKAKKESVNIYNAQCASSKAKYLSLNLTSGSNGLGLALNF